MLNVRFKNQLGSQFSLLREGFNVCINGKNSFTVFLYALKYKFSFCILAGTKESRCREKKIQQGKTGATFGNRVTLTPLFTVVSKDSQR